MPWSHRGRSGRAGAAPRRRRRQRRGRPHDGVRRLRVLAERAVRAQRGLRAGGAAAGGRGRLGQGLRAGLQHPHHRRRHRCGRLPAAHRRRGAGGGRAPPPGPALLLHDHPGPRLRLPVRGLLLLPGHQQEPAGGALQLGVAAAEQQDQDGAGGEPGLLRAAQQHGRPRRLPHLPGRVQRLPGEVQGAAGPGPPRQVPDVRREDAAALGRGPEDPGGGRALLQLHGDPGSVAGHALPQPEGPQSQPQRLLVGAVAPPTKPRVPPPPSPVRPPLAPCPPPTSPSR